MHLIFFSPQGFDKPAQEDFSDLIEMSVCELGAPELESGVELLNDFVVLVVHIIRLFL